MASGVLQCGCSGVIVSHPFKLPFLFSSLVKIKAVWRILNVRGHTLVKFADVVSNRIMCIDERCDTAAPSALSSAGDDGRFLCCCCNSSNRLESDGSERDLIILV